MKTINKVLMVLASSCLFAPLAANAALISADFTGNDGNDCAGFFGGNGEEEEKGFDACQIFFDKDGQRIEISPVIAKYDAEDPNDHDVNNTDFQDTSLSDFDFGDLGNSTSGHWKTSETFDPAKDPGVRYWAAKGGNAFRLFWEIDETEDTSGACNSNPFNLECLNLAQVVTGGDWNTFSLDGKNPAISHLTLYNSEPPRMVPEPASLLLFGIGMFALGVIRRKAGHS